MPPPPLSQPQSFVIVGAGTAGLAAALLLRRAGHAVEVSERVPTPGPVGAGILLQPTGLFVLDALGLAEGALTHGARVERLYGRTTGGRRVLDLAYADLAPGLAGLGIHRGVLFELLYQAVLAAGIPVRCGVEVRRIEERADGVVLHGPEGPLGPPADRALVCDGARSTLRPPGASARPYPWGAIWLLLPEPAPLGQLDGGTLFQVYRDTRQMLGFLPTGRPWGAAGRQTSLFWSVRVDQAEALRAEGPAALATRIRALFPEAPLEGLGADDPLLFAPYFDVHLPCPHTERVAWLGDSAHAMSPQLGQGANLALWDAWVLSQSADLPAWARARRDHLRFYQLASRWLTPFFQSSFPVLAPLRDLVAGPLHAWGWYRRQMLGSLAGAKTGIFSSLPESPRLLGGGGVA